MHWMGERVVVAMSGGVDSSVAAALLVERGYEVIGVMLRLWSEPPPMIAGDGQAAEYANRCCSLESMNDARAVAERLGIPFYAVNAERLFKEKVVDFFVQGYAAGLTPNPCLACNRAIRFGYLLSYARLLGARYLATGHYARLRRDRAGRFELWRGIDRNKDQSYVLSVLGQSDLASVLFPVGEYAKAEVRALAAKWDLPTASRVESQDLCFIADGDYRRFLADWAPECMQPGPILDRRGRRLGTHRGLPFYTVGQRSGLGIAAARPLYVLALDPRGNALVVGGADELGQDWLRAGPVNWMAGQLPAQPLRAEVQIRYRATPVPALVTPLSDGWAEVRFSRPVRDISPGQTAAFFHGEVCLGGGVITESRPALAVEDDHAGPDLLD
jgi:tRNA-specific 2-thiouridylase